MHTLTIKPEQFDKEVWQTETDFHEREYNEWLRGAIVSLKATYQTLNELVSEIDVVGEKIDDSDINYIGDVINLLSNIKIKVL